MRWEELTSTDFTKAVKDTSICILTMGVVEKHGDHLPLGTDYMIGHTIACLAAQKEAAIVFPPFYFGQIFEARCFPGTITIKPTLLIDLILEVIDEIGRNGFKKIILYNSHGGNDFLVGFLSQCALWSEKTYSIYIPKNQLTSEGLAKWKEIVDADYGGHACERETSLILGMYPELAHIERIPEQPARALNRIGHLPPTMTGIWWYADHPDHYAGDARSASIIKGKVLVDLMVDCLAEYIAAVKADTVIPTLNAEFYQKVREVSHI